MKVKIALLLFFVYTMSGCAPTQKVTGFWSDPESNSGGSYKKIFVIVISPNTQTNYYLESELRKTLISKGYKVVRFNDIFPPSLNVGKDITREQFTESIKMTGCDGVMTLALLDAQTVESYHPGTSYYPSNYGYYGSYYGYYNFTYPQVYTPGYYSVDKTFFLETNAYDVASDKLLWSVQSEAKNPKSLEAGFVNYSKMLINFLKGKGLAKKWQS
jgi:hypothetical protein